MWSSSPTCIASRCLRSAMRAFQGGSRRGSSFIGSTASSKSRRSRSGSMRDNAPALLGGHDLVIDGSDNFATRLAVSDACVALGIPLLSAAAVQFQGQVGLFRVAALLPLLCRRRFRRGRLRQLRRARRAWRAHRDRGQLRGAARDQSDRRRRRRSGRQLHLFDGEKLSWRAISIPADPAAGPAASYSVRR